MNRTFKTILFILLMSWIGIRLAGILVFFVISYFCQVP